MDTGHGKRSCCLELEEPDGLTTLRELVAGADVFTQGYRGGSLERRGLGPENLAEIRPGIVVVTINCYGDAGPWRSRPGWEQMAQTVSGMAVGQGDADHPASCPPPPATTPPATWPPWGPSPPSSAGPRRAAATTSGPPFVRPPPGSPARPPPPPPLPQAPSFGDVESYMTSSTTPYGRLRHLSPVAKMPLTPPRWDVPTSPIGSHPPSWEPARRR